MLKVLLIVAVWTGNGNSQTHSLDITPFDSMDECRAARAVVAQSQFPRDWITIQNDSLWQADKPGFLQFDRYKLECVTSKSSTQEF